MNRLTIIGVLVLALVLVVFGAPQPAHSQIGALQQRLAGVTKLDCNFSTLVTGDWNDGVPSATVDTAEIQVSFFDINIDEGTAEADSQFGASFIVVRYSNDYLHLMQMFNSGPLYVTTILARETGNGQLMAVHTRHEFTPTRLVGFTSRPEMYIGGCSSAE